MPFVLLPSLGYSWHYRLMVSKGFRTCKFILYAYPRNISLPTTSALTMHPYYDTKLTFNQGSVSDYNIMELQTYSQYEDLEASLVWTCIKQTGNGFRKRNSNGIGLNLSPHKKMTWNCNSSHVRQICPRAQGQYIQKTKSLEQGTKSFMRCQINIANCLNKYL